MIPKPCKVTVLIPTSFAPSHPSIVLVRTAVCSVRRVLSLPSTRILVCCDGPPRDADARERYEEYKARLKAFAPTEGSTVVERSTHGGLPGVLLEGFQWIDTPLVLVFQHDFEVVRSIDVTKVCETLLRDDLQVKHLRLNHRTTRPIKSDFVLKPYEHPKAPLPLLRTSSWSDMPHFARTSYYRERVLPLIRASSGRLGVENRLGPLLLADIDRLGFDTAHPLHGTFLYGRLGDPPIVRHLDGRRRKPIDG